ncbi:MAG: Mov34/MPN/PAD-1 family protein, partial [Nostoc sp.]
NPFVETGGILVGRISETQQAFIVTDILPAPQDSQRSKYEFVLGTSAVKKMLEQYSSSCNYALYCLGTWHSHLSDSGPSERDLQTAMEVASSRSIPSVLLIRTPLSYCAVSASIY